MARRLLAATLLVVAVLVGMARPADAHAQLVEQSPKAGAVLEAPPRAVTLTFSEPVEAALGAIRVYNADGERTDSGALGRPSADTVRTRLPELGKGSYVVTWRVVSADSHPVSGSFTFQVGAESASLDPSVVDRLLTAADGDSSVGVLFGVARFSTFAGLALLIGGVGFLLITWPGGWSDARAGALLWLGWGLAVVGTVAGLALQGPDAAALGLRDALDADVLRQVLDTRFGEVGLGRLGLLALAVPLLFVLRQRRGGRAVRLGLVAVIGGLACTPALAGHASTGDLVPLAVVADTVHVLSISCWLGGLAVMVVALLPRRDLGELRATVPRSSTYFLVSVALVVLSGAFASWRQVGSLDVVLDTDYGRLLLVKLVVFLALILLAAFSRDVVNRLWREEPETDADDADGANDAVEHEREIRRLRRVVGVEVLLGVAVLALSAVLVNTVPAKDAAAAETSFADRLESSDGEYLFDVIVDPAETGFNDVHVTILRSSGAPTDVVDMAVTLSLPSREIAPIEAPLRRLGPGHYLAPGVDLPIAGDWLLTARARVDQFTEATATAAVSVR